MVQREASEADKGVRQGHKGGDSPVECRRKPVTVTIRANSPQSRCVVSEHFCSLENTEQRVLGVFAEIGSLALRGRDDNSLQDPPSGR